MTTNGSGFQNLLQTPENDTKGSTREDWTSSPTKLRRSIERLYLPHSFGSSSTTVMLNTFSGFSGLSVSSVFTLSIACQNACNQISTLNCEADDECVSQFCMKNLRSIDRTKKRLAKGVLPGQRLGHERHAQKWYASCLDEEWLSL